MKFKFAKNLDYQLDAINAVVNLFDFGKNTFIQEKRFELRSSVATIANDFEIDPAKVFLNIREQQKTGGIELINKLESLDFSVEMETGTGKTYVYIRTALELNKKYGLKKFIILVPSVAIREGVMKTFEQTKDHFRELYGTGYGYFTYDSSKLSRVREFVQSLDVQFMIMTIQSFNKKDMNIMHQEPDSFYGEKPIDLVAQTHPVVIMDEPQNMESDLSKEAIQQLHPLFKLRYSATHKEIHNLIYRLTPVEAYQKGLVKKIEVYGVQEDDPNAFVFTVEDLVIQRNKPVAKVLLEVKRASGEYEIERLTLNGGDDLAELTDNPKYVDLIVEEINAKTNIVSLSNGKSFGPEVVDSKNIEPIFRTQIRETIKAHLKKQADLGERVKVLSLFFIDRVNNYTAPDGLIKRIFDEEFEQRKTSSPRFRKLEADAVQAGYFASKKEKGETTYLDTKGDSKADSQAYDLIMKDKERLLSLEEPVSFIFSHSALREGWDNPNVFQICTLRETRSTKEKRQMIGRGLRLPVDNNGDRVYDEEVNVLTVIANESYKAFAENLQKEYIEAGYTSAPQTENVRDRLEVKYLYSTKPLPADFVKLWKKIRQQTTYRLQINSAKLVKQVVEQINEITPASLVVRVDRARIADLKTFRTVSEGKSYGAKISGDIHIGNIVDRLSQETGLTKQTIFKMLSEVKNLDILMKNPEDYLRKIISIIQNELREGISKEGLEYVPTGKNWEMNIFEDFGWYREKSVKTDRSLFGYIAVDSKGEKEFAENLEESSRIKFFLKLPSKFLIETPIGNYNPDWAIVMDSEEGERLYFVRETKFVDDLANLRPSEQQKIEFGKKHFEAVDVDFKEIRRADLSDLE